MSLSLFNNFFPQLNSTYLPTLPSDSRQSLLINDLKRSITNQINSNQIAETAKLLNSHFELSSISENEYQELQNFSFESFLEKFFTPIDSFDLDFPSNLLRKVQTRFEALDLAVKTGLINKRHSSHISKDMYEPKIEEAINLCLEKKNESFMVTTYLDCFYSKGFISVTLYSSLFERARQI
jgi:hypothetical protein